MSNETEEGSKPGHDDGTRLEEAEEEDKD